MSSPICSTASSSSFDVELREGVGRAELLGLDALLFEAVGTDGLDHCRGHALGLLLTEGEVLVVQVLDGRVDVGLGIDLVVVTAAAPDGEQADGQRNRESSPRRPRSFASASSSVLRLG